MMTPDDAWPEPLPIDDKLKRVPPETYNRLKHPSLKQYHDYVNWLRETAISELQASGPEPAAAKEVFLRFFRRGLRADLLLAELVEMVRSIVWRLDWSEAQVSQVITVVKALTLTELGIRGDEKG